MPLEQLIEAFQSFGLPGLLIVVVVLILIYVARISGLVATGNQARIANIVLTAILFGLSEDPTATAALQAAIASIASALLYELFKKIGERFPTPQLK